MRLKLHSVSIILILAVQILTGCDLYLSRSVNIYLPANQLVAEWVIEYPEYLESGLPVYTSEIIPAGQPGECTETIVRIARGVNLPVFALPVLDLSSSGVDARLTGNFPAAAVYPTDMDSGQLQLKFEDGFACELLQRCLHNSDAVAGFNTLRFRESIAEKTAELEAADEQPLPGGCWILDPEPVICRLGYGLFRESSIKAAETMDFNIPVLSGGNFISDNPFYPPVEASGGPSMLYLNVILPVNRRTAFFSPESGEVIEVFFDDKRWCWTNFLSGASESGRR